MGTIFSQQREFEDAALIYDKAIALKADYADAHLGFANVLKNLGRREEAIKYFRSFLELRPDDPEATHLLAAYLGEESGPAPARYISNLFDTYAKNFDRDLIENLQYKAPQLLREAVARISGLDAAAWRVLDLGCGTGLCGTLFRDLASHLGGGLFRLGLVNFLFFLGFLSSPSFLLVELKGIDPPDLMTAREKASKCQKH
ncbi:MAG TPA: hypothetical protein DDZ83_13110 [Nitrospinae bacterium]|nr:hypothetical protein [Nitrospinota bacterium]